jgi:small GTP-binding protein
MVSPISTVQKKICMLGNYAVGKTSLVRRFVDGRFDDRYLSTIGVKISRRLVELPQRPVHLLIWDLAGSDEFAGFTGSYQQGAAGALLVCDLTRAVTLPVLKEHAAHLREVNPYAALVLLGNKADLVDNLEVEEDELAGLAEKLAASWYITSAKTGAGVEDAFKQLAQRLIETV